MYKDGVPVDICKYKYDEIDLIPHELVEEREDMTLTSRGYIFSGPEDFCSNFFEAPFNYDNNRYLSVARNLFQLYLGILCRFIKMIPCLGLQGFKIGKSPPGQKSTRIF